MSGTEEEQMRNLFTTVQGLPVKKQVLVLIDLISCVKGEVESSLDEMAEESDEYEKANEACEALEQAESSAQDALNAMEA